MITDKQTHTPGPWYVVASGICASPTPQSGALYIAWHNVSSSYRDSGEQAANARLIAAAPALLEALKSLMGRFERTGEAWMGDPAMQQARAAIAQAEGRAK